MSVSPNSNRSDFKDLLENEEHVPTKIARHTVLQLGRQIRNHPRPLIFGLATVCVGIAMALLEPRIFGYAIDEAILPKQWELLVRIGALYFFVTSLRVLCTYLQSYFFEFLGQSVTQELRVQLFSHLQRLPTTTYDRHSGGRLLTRVTNDITALAEMFSAGFAAMLYNLLLVGGILVWLLVLDLRLGLISISVFPLLVAVSIYFSHQLRTTYRLARSRLSALNSFLAENLSGMKILHLFNREALHLERFQQLNQAYAEAQSGSIRVYAYFQPAITIASGLSVSLLIWFGGRESLEGTVKLGVLVVFFSYLLSLFQPIREIADKWNIILSGLTAAERIFSILSWPTELAPEQVTSPAEPLPGIRGKIQFENVWFSYPDTPTHWALKEFSLEIQPGEKIGIVGHTGAGKSTVIALLLRLYEPQRGRILLDGIDLRDYDKRRLRASIGLVQQEVFLFSGSFEENMTFWKKSESKKALTIAHELAIEPKTLRERGNNLSLGERQILAFSRAIVKSPQLWILDEATANLDTMNENRIQAYLTQKSFNQTCLFIAHRLSTVKKADRILVLHQGILVESGTHDSLLQQKGLYFKLYQFQSLNRLS